jgi:hypothetical protein
MLNSVEKTGTNHQNRDRESMGEPLVLSQCSLLKHPYPEPTRVLQQYREEETNSWFSIFRGVSI